MNVTLSCFYCDATLVILTDSETAAMFPDNVVKVTTICPKCSSAGKEVKNELLFDKDGNIVTYSGM